MTEHYSERAQVDADWAWWQTISNALGLDRLTAFTYRQSAQFQGKHGYYSLNGPLVPVLEKAAVEHTLLRERVAQLEGALRPILAEYDNTHDCESDGEQWRVSAFIHTHLMEKAREVLEGKEGPQDGA